MRVRILGAGIIGLACADELLRRGHEVEVADPRPGSGASRVAAGMLSPSGEAWHGEDALFRLGMRSAAMWPEYADRLGVPLTRGGTLLVALDRQDQRRLEQQVGVLLRQGRPAEVLDRTGVRRLEPGLGSRVTAAALVDDRSVDPRAVLEALLQRVPVVASASGAEPEVTVLATGARLPAPYTHLVRAVRGEVVRVHTDDPPERPVRGWVRGTSVYVVPRATGEVVIGATVEEHDDRPRVTLGGVHQLLDAARELLPALDRAEWREASAGNRPGTRDNLPLVGPSGEPGVAIAGGHFRNGILLAPVTARLLADHLETGEVEPAVDPRRFAGVVGERGLGPNGTNPAPRPAVWDQTAAAADTGHAVTGKEER